MDQDDSGRCILGGVPVDDFLPRRDDIDMGLDECLVTCEVVVVVG